MLQNIDPLLFVFDEAFELDLHCFHDSVRIPGDSTSGFRSTSIRGFEDSNIQLQDSAIQLPKARKQGSIQFNGMALI